MGRAVPVEKSKAESCANFLEDDRIQATMPSVSKKLLISCYPSWHVPGEG